MSLSLRISSYNRERKWQQFLDEFRPTSATTVLDAGFSDREYSPVDNYLEKRYPWLSQVTALGVDVPLAFPVRYPHVTARQYAGGHMPFDNREFDVAWSNAVLEHVGDREAQVAFVRELLRVSDAIFLTTPNRYFPVEVHTRIPFLHWLPKGIFDAVARAFGKGWATGGYMNLLGRIALESVVAEAGASARIIPNRMGPLVLDFVVVARRDADGEWSGVPRP